MRTLDPPPRWPARIVARIARRVLRTAGLLPAPAEIRTALVVRTDDRVGNALLTIPLVRALQAALPAARVELLLAAPRAVVAEGLPNLSIVKFDKFDAFKNPLRFVGFLQSLAARYDVVFDAAHWHAFSLTSALLSRWAAKRFLIGADRGGMGFFYDAAVPAPEQGIAEVEAKVALAAGLGLRLPAPPLETALGRRPSPVAGRFCALNPGARKADHRWPAARFAALARALQEKRALLSAVFWGPGEESLAREVVALAPGAAQLAPPTDLDQLAAAFRAAALVVSNDTGPMHLAVACGAPVLAVFAHAANLRFAHPGAKFAAVLADADDIAVLAAAGRLLDTSAAPTEPARSSEGTA